MALGGGTFVSQNKVLPGAYINFISVATASGELSDRGVAAMALELDWGADDEIFTITRDEFLSKSNEILGYDYGHEKLKGLRDLFQNIHTLVAYKLTSGGDKAENDFAVAKHTGVRGNDIQIIIQEQIDGGMFEVSTALDGRIVDEQVVSDVSELEDNAFVEFKDNAVLAETAGTPLINGTNGSVDVASHQRFLDLAESQPFNAMGVVSDDEKIKALYATHTESMRDDRGKKFQTVVHNHPADYEGVINVKNDVLDDENAGSLVYWVTGVAAGKPVNASALNDIYAGEYEVDVDFTQTELEQAIKSGEFALHRVGDNIRVLNDINSLISTTAEKGDMFKENQTVRVVDQIANDIATLFAEKYLGSIPNDQSGRVSLQSDIVSQHESLQDIRAIEDFSADDVSVEQGNDKKSVVANTGVTIVNTMEKLYMTTVVQ